MKQLSLFKSIEPIFTGQCEIFIPETLRLCIKHKFINSCSGVIKIGIVGPTS